MGVWVPYVKAHTKTGELVYRRIIPRDLQPFAGRTQIRKFLGGRKMGLPIVEQRLGDARSEYDDTVRQARHRAEVNRREREGTLTGLTPSLIERIVLAGKADMLENDDWARWQPRTPLRRAERQRRLRENTQADMAEAMAWRAAGDLDAIVQGWTGEIERITEERGLFIALEGEAFRALCRDFNDGLIEAYGGVLQRLDGAKVPTPEEPLLAAIEPDTVANSNEAGKTVSGLIKAYKLAKWDGWSQSSRTAVEPAFRALKDAVGNKLVAEIDRNGAREVFEMVKALPAALGRNKALKNLPVPEAIRRGREMGLPTIGPKTVNGSYIAHISAAFGWAVEEDWIPKNPFRGLAAADPVADKDKRDPFTMPQLKKLFSATPWAARQGDGHPKPGQFWLPLIALFSGARLGEIAGLRMRDIEELEGVLCLRIRPYPGRPLKTAESRRDLPIHSKLQGLGLGAYFDHRRTQAGDPDALVFPDGKANVRGQWGAKLSERFGQHLKALEITGTKLGIHSFRHNVEDRLRAAGLYGRPEGQALLGRKVAGSEAVYGNGYTVRQLQEALEMVTYAELHLSHLKPR